MWTWKLRFSHLSNEESNTQPSGLSWGFKAARIWIVIYGWKAYCTRQQEADTQKSTVSFFLLPVCLLITCFVQLSLQHPSAYGMNCERALGLMPLGVLPPLLRVLVCLTVPSLGESSRNCHLYWPAISPLSLPPNYYWPLGGAQDFIILAGLGQRQSTESESTNRYSVIICWMKGEMHGRMDTREEGKAWLLKAFSQLKFYILGILSSLLHVWLWGP